MYDGLNRVYSGNVHLNYNSDPSLSTYEICRLGEFTYFQTHDATIAVRNPTIAWLGIIKSAPCSSRYWQWKRWLLLRWTDGWLDRLVPILPLQKVETYLLSAWVWIPCRHFEAQTSRRWWNRWGASLWHILHCIKNTGCSHVSTNAQTSVAEIRNLICFSPGRISHHSW